MDAPITNTAETICYAPATGDEIGRSALNTTEDVQRAIAHARTAQPAWAALSIKARARRLKPLSRYIADNADYLAQIISQDNGKTRTDAMATELLPAAMAVRYYCRNAGRFLKDRRLMPGNLLLANKASKLVKVPYGVVGIISPWNYPFSIPFSEVIMALVAGNAVVLKVASETQLVGRAIERCMASVDLPPGLFTHINVPGRQAGEALLSNGVDKLIFTGSVAVGKTLMAQASQTLTPLVLELGGNDAMLVCPDADIERAVGGAVWAGLQNCGQSCGGVERVYVHRDVYQAFIKQLAERVENLRVGIDSDHDIDLGAMTTTKQMGEVKRQIMAAVDAGAEVLAHSKAPVGTRGNFLPAMVLIKVDHNMEIMRQETFGPVLCVMPVEDMAHAVTLANDSDLGLTASVWTTDTSAGEQLARQIRAGVVMINDHLMSHGLAETPWGGFKQSGIGRTHGAVGMEEMSQTQCLVHDYMPRVKRNMWWHPHGPEIYQGMSGILAMLYSRNILNRFQGVKRAVHLMKRTFRSDEELTKPVEVQDEQS